MPFTHTLRCAFFPCWVQLVATSCSWLQLRCFALRFYELHCAALFFHAGATICRCAALRFYKLLPAALRCFLLVILHKSYHSFTHVLCCASKNTLCVFTIWVILARYNQSQKTRRCCRRSNTSPLKILNFVEQINNIIWCIAA